jgi:hypothetical protein
MKIPHNSLVKIYGWVMLRKVKDGKKYLIKHDDVSNIYWFCTPSTKKVKIGHFFDDVDCWVKSVNHGDYNKIVILN